MIIDDDVHIGNLLEEVLEKEGYNVLRAYSGTEALLLLSASTPDLVLLDLMLPGINGEEVLAKITNIPVIIISAKVGIDDKIQLLKDGAADYITKPFDINELLARVAVQLRIKARHNNSDKLSYNGLVMDINAHSVIAEGIAVKLTKTEFAILKQLVKNPTQVFTKSRILDLISLDTPDCMESSLKVHISNLRKKLRDAAGREYIEAVWGIGFKMHE